MASQLSITLLMTFAVQGVFWCLPAKAQVYHTQVLPLGDYHFYERALKKNVSYVRLNNQMIGAVYNAREPGVFTCFTATISSGRVNVFWWKNLWIIGKPQLESLSQSYTIAAFTADNSTPSPGLDNPGAVRQCAQEF